MNNTVSMDSDVQFSLIPVATRQPFTGFGNSSFSFPQAQQQQPQQAAPLLTQTLPSSGSFFGNVSANNSIANIAATNISNGSFFNQTPQTPKPAPNLAANKQTGLYSKLADITDDDRANFESNEFHSPIPIIPPPYEVCF